VGVGPISQSDVQLAVPLGAKILGFNVRPSGGDVEAMAKQHGLDIRCVCVVGGVCLVLARCLPCCIWYVIMEV
jgi:hypothetical protein